MTRRRRFSVAAFDHGEPLWRANVSLIAATFLCLTFILVPLTVRVKTHAVVINISDGELGGKVRGAWSDEAPLHVLVVTRDGVIFWDDAPITERELWANLVGITERHPRPRLVFVPESHASYNLVARVLNIITGTGAAAENFCLGNVEPHRVFDKATQTQRRMRAPVRPWPDFELADPPREAISTECQIRASG